MSDTTTVTPAESVTAIDLEMPAPGTEGYEEWRKTGKLPSVEDSAPPEEDEAERRSKELDAAEAAEIAAAESKPAVTRVAPASTTPQRKKKTGDERIKELANRNRELQERLDALERRTAPPEEKREPAAPQPATGERPKPKMGDLDSEGKPKYKTLEEFQDDRDAWLQERWQSESRKAEEARTQREQERILNEGLTEKCRPAMEKYPDYVEVTGNPHLLIPKGCAVELFLRGSKNPGEVWYYLGKHPEILEKFYSYDPKTERWGNKIHPLDQARELFEIEATFTQPPPASKPAASSARVITQAPRVPHQVSGQAPTADALAKAVEDGDQEAYTRLENERALAARKAGRRK